jgi:hypothetical protein
MRAGVREGVTFSRESGRLRLEMRDATRNAEIEALNRVELALNDSLTELLFAVRAALHENSLTTSQREKLEDAYRSGRQVVSALDRVAAELENGDDR